MINKYEPMFSWLKRDIGKCFCDSYKIPATSYKLQNTHATYSSQSVSNHVYLVSFAHCEPVPITSAIPNQITRLLSQNQTCLFQLRNCPFPYISYCWLNPPKKGRRRERDRKETKTNQKINESSDVSFFFYFPQASAATRYVTRMNPAHNRRSGRRF